MGFDLTSRMRKALQKLRYECDFEDDRIGGADNYILRNKLAPGIGDKTLSDLQELGLIESGLNRWANTTGYRITDLGRKVLEAKPPRKMSIPRRKLKPLPPRLGEPKGRFDK